MTGPRRAGRRRLAAACLAVALAATAACGVPGDDHPRPISKEQIPGSSTGKTTDTAGAQTQPAAMFFTQFQNDAAHLVPAEVPVPVGSSSPSLVPATVLETLLSANPGENGDPYGTNIPPDTALLGEPDLDGGVLTIDLNQGINNIRSDGARLAYGQIVCTADALGDVDAVLISVEGRPRQVPVGDGGTTSDPVTCTSYANLLAPGVALPTG